MRNYTAAADKTLVIKNIYDVKNVVESEIALAGLAGAEGVWNTGANAVAGEAAIVADDSAFVAQHIASIRLYNSNSYVYLHPGDSLTITTKSANETLYYATMKSDLIKVTDTDEDASNDVIVETEDVDADADGIVDYDDPEVAEGEDAGAGGGDADPEDEGTDPEA